MAGEKECLNYDCKNKIGEIPGKSIAFSMGSKTGWFCHSCWFFITKGKRLEEYLKEKRDQERKISPNPSMRDMRDYRIEGRVMPGLAYEDPRNEPLPTVEVTLDEFEHLLACLANQKFINDPPNADGLSMGEEACEKIREVNQSVIDQTWRWGMDKLERAKGEQSDDPEEGMVSVEELLERQAKKEKPIGRNISSKGFEEGKFYRHLSSGEILHILARLSTTMWDSCLVAESSRYNHLKPVGSDEGASQGWEEVSRKEWEKCFEKERKIESVFRQGLASEIRREDDKEVFSAAQELFSKEEPKGEEVSDRLNEWLAFAKGGCQICKQSNFFYTRSCDMLSVPRYFKCVNCDNFFTGFNLLRIYRLVKDNTFNLCKYNNPDFYSPCPNCGVTDKIIDRDTSTSFLVKESFCSGCGNIFKI